MTTSPVVQPRIPQLVGESAVMTRLLALLQRVAQSPATTVLLSGESGTGKDLAARFLHHASPRHSQPFVTITCTALSESLLDSELFGHERGSFTDAKQRKLGLLELAHGGTLFLDEVGDMSAGLQAKLLRFLEDHTFVRVGGAQEVHVDVRVVAATHRDLAAEVRAGRFREDLYFRLRVLPVRVPPLRERDGDVLLLAQHFLQQFGGQGAPACRLDGTARQRLLSHPWPGNVRELRNAVERAVLLADAPLLDAAAFDLDAPAREAASGPGEHRTPPPPTAQDPAAPFPGRLLQLPAGGIDIAALETDLVLQAIERTQGNQAVAAELLGMTRDQIRYRVAKLRDHGALPKV